MLLDISAIAHNGPAIKGGCVTWRSHPVTGPDTLATKLSRWQDRYGTCFCRPGAIFITFWRGRGTSLISDRVVVLVLENW
jgi:hypothetical protein